MQSNSSRDDETRARLCSGLLTTLLMTTALTWPGGAAQAQCVTVGDTTANCTGDLSGGVADGVDFNAPPVDTINIFDVTGNIMPAAGADGVFAETSGAGEALTISVDTAPFEIITDGNHATGIRALTRGAGSAVTFTNAGAVSTPGDFSFGILMTTFGDFSNVEITNRGAVSTKGDTATGISANTGDSGAGTGHNSSIILNNWGRIDTQGLYSTGISAFTEGNDSAVTLTNDGAITTTGPFASGIVAGTKGTNSAVTIDNQAAISTLRDDAVGINVLTTNNNSEITITNRAPIITKGNDAEGIIAGSIGGNSPVTIDNWANVMATGPSSHAIGVFTDGDLSDTTINLHGGLVQGGTGLGNGVRLSIRVGETGTLNVLAGATVTTLGDTAIEGFGGDQTVNNWGTVTGNVKLGPNTNAFHTMAGGIFNAGATVNLGGLNLLTNEGVFSPGGSGNTVTTEITGHFIQTGSGVLGIDMFAGVPIADRTNVSGTADLAGQVVLNISDAAFVKPGAQQAIILRAAGGVTDNGLTLAQDNTATVDFELLFPNANTVALGATVDFTPTGLNANQSAVAQTVNAIQMAGGSAALGPAIGGLLSVPDLDSLGNAYDQLGPQIYLANGVATLFSALDFTDELMSCETRDRGNVFIAEDQCVWARVSGNWLDQDDTSQTIGFDRWAARFSGGVQAELAPDWRIGLALGYEHGDLNALGGLQNSKSDTVYGGAAIKYTKGNGLLAAALSGGHGWYDTTRNLAFGGFGGQATASHNISQINARLRGAWAFTRDNRYIKPMVDLNLSWIDMGGFTESGGAGLTVQGSQETVLSVTPAVEFGWQSVVSDNTFLRPYVRAGVTLFDDPSFATVSGFTAAPAGTAGFQTTMSTDDVIGEIAAGMDVLMTNGAAVKVFYEGRFGETTIQQSGGLKASMTF